MRKPLGDKNSIEASMLPFNSKNKENNPCRKELDQLNLCMEKNDEDMDKCKNFMSSFNLCRRENPI
jgi:hypothetical protein